MQKTVSQQIDEKAKNLGLLIGFLVLGALYFDRISIYFSMLYEHFANNRPDSSSWFLFYTAGAFVAKLIIWTYKQVFFLKMKAKSFKSHGRIKLFALAADYGFLNYSSKIGFFTFIFILVNTLIYRSSYHWNWPAFVFPMVVQCFIYFPAEKWVIFADADLDRINKLRKAAQSKTASDVDSNITPEEVEAEDEEIVSSDIETKDRERELEEYLQQKVNRGYGRVL